MKSSAIFILMSKDKCYVFKMNNIFTQANFAIVF